MNTRIYCLLLAIALCSTTFAQDEEKKDEEEEVTGFNWNKVFVGGGLSVGGGTGLFAIGVMPEAGYSIFDWMDIGPAFNFNYMSQKYYINGQEIKQRNTIVGAGMFLRVYPVDFLFIQIQPEHNWMKIKLRNETYGFEETYNYTAMSALGGVGYAQRVVGESNFYIMLMIDLMQEVNSPYRDNQNRAIPFFRSGFNFYLGQKAKRR